MKTDIRTKGITGENTGTSEYDDEIAKIENEIAELKNARKSIYESKRISTSDVNPAANAKANSHIGVDVLGGKGTLSSRFGMRGNKNHNGDDIAAPKDTPVTTPDLYGIHFTVDKIANDKDGYGNYVDLSGELNGHKIGFRFAHMGDNTIKVRAGQALKAEDFIGGVGNTGNSRGKNGGYHLHVETRIDGETIAPSEFRECRQND